MHTRQIHETENKAIFLFFFLDKLPTWLRLQKTNKTSACINAVNKPVWDIALKHLHNIKWYTPVTVLNLKEQFTMTEFNFAVLSFLWCTCDKKKLEKKKHSKNYFHKG